MKVTLFRRLLIIVCGVAATSTALTVTIQERALSSDLRSAAVKRLENSAAAAEGLVAAHVRSLAERYRSIAATPQFRATLEINDGPTLSHYADSLASREGASRILFVGAEEQIVAAGGSAPPDEVALAARAGALLEHAGRPYAAVSLALESAGQPLGRLIAVEAIGDATIAEWSKLCGARIAFAPAGRAAGSDPERTVLALGSLEMLVASSLDAERAALARARLNLFGSGALGLAAAFAASVLLSRQLVRPIIELREGAARIGKGDLTVSLRSGRLDEIGDAARAFEGMSAALRETVGGVAAAADRVESSGTEIGGVMRRLVAVVGDQMRASDDGAASMEKVNEQVRRIAGSAARSSLALERAIDGSSLSFRELASTGDELGRSAAAMSERVDEISASLAQSVASARRVSQIREELVSAAAETRVRMEEMEGAACDVNASAGRGAELWARMIETAEVGRRRVLEAVDGMNDVRSATDEAQRAIAGLDERVAKIGSIVEVIDDVTDETGLLALNASIIAAQSGEGGRAFAVVADQMKEVADRVLAGTREIHTLMRAVQEESANATGAIERSSESAASGFGRAEAAGEALDEITVAARESGKRMSEFVASASAQQRAAADVLAQSERVRGAAGQLHSAADEQDRGNEVILRNATELRGVAAAVRQAIDAQAAGAARIGTGIATVRESMDSINRALSEQSEACRQAAQLLAGSRAHTRTSEESVDRMSAAIDDLLRQAEQLRRDVQRFRIA